ncbi:hypothetical protein QBC44DRAFT_363714 [Cladorrhinum sp. PSN332]|nr:hypothetical protein QBC44DRAFT_363714 [Cladorrhinum sp. PSN332]
MSTQCTLDCFAEPRELQSNPHIGGTGVLVGFMGTAWFVVMLVIVYYLLAFDPLKSPCWTPGGSGHSPRATTSDDFTPNIVDQFVVSGVRWVGRLLGSHLREGRASQPIYQWFSRWLLDRSRWETAFRVAILSMRDIQILTGLGILLSRYIGLSCYVSAYHWQLVVDLAWLSNLTHVACITVLRGYLHHHPQERKFRLFGMTVL